MHFYLASDQIIDLRQFRFVDGNLGNPNHKWCKPKIIQKLEKTFWRKWRKFEYFKMLKYFKLPSGYEHLHQNLFTWTCSNQPAWKTILHFDSAHQHTWRPHILNSLLSPVQLVCPLKGPYKTIAKSFWKQLQFHQRLWFRAFEIAMISYVVSPYNIDYVI